MKLIDPLLPTKLQSGQILTQMVGNWVDGPRDIKVSTVLVDLGDAPSDRYWQTLVMDLEGKVQIPEFLERGFEIRTEDITERALAHNYVVQQLKQSGYRVVYQEDDFDSRRRDEYLEAVHEHLDEARLKLIETGCRSQWNEWLKNVPGMDFTLDELRRLEFLRYLRQKGRI